MLGGSGTLLAALLWYVGANPGLANTPNEAWRCILVEREECNQQLIETRASTWSTMDDPVTEAGTPSSNDLVFGLRNHYSRPKYERLEVCTFCFEP